MSPAKSMGFACSPPPYLSLAQAPAPAQSSGPGLAQTALTIGINYASGGAGILDSTVSIPRIAGRIIIYVW